MGFIQIQLIGDTIIHDIIENFINTEMRHPNKNSKKKKRYVTFRCLSCGKVAEKTYQASRPWKSLCMSCVQRKYTTDDFVSVGQKHFGSKYDYSKTKLATVTEKVTIICPVHGEFQQRAWEHMSGHGCNQCKFDQKSKDQTIPLAIWEERLELYPLISFKKVTDLGYHSPVKLTCKIHGDFTVQLGQIGKSKHLCKHCAYAAHQPQSIRKELISTEATIYYVYLPDIDMYKFGVTVNLEERLKQLGDHKVIATGTKEYIEALRLEHEAHLALDRYRYKGRKVLIKNDSTELYKQCVLKQLKRALQK